MKYLWIVAAVITTAFTKKCKPETITVEIYKDTACKHLDKKATLAFGTVSKSMTTLFSEKCINHSKADCTKKGMVIKGWKNAKCTGSPTGTYKVTWDKCMDKRKYKKTSDEDNF